MKRIAMMLVLVSGLCSAQSNREEYGINVHVSSSQWIVVPSSIGPLGVQKLTVLINGKKYELEAQMKDGVTLLNLGDYKAKLVQDVHKTNYESSQAYEFQFADKKTLKFTVVGQME